MITFTYLYKGDISFTVMTSLSLHVQYLYKFNNIEALLGIFGKNILY
ncbi:hypothetical protein HMPREF3205_01627 [Streptococcus pasteurianus]|nr:hypothetical protein HMPREF3205_01627 [Streptococcus pasteurianus]